MKLIYEHTCTICGAIGRADTGSAPIGPGTRLPDLHFTEMKWYMPEGWRYLYVDRAYGGGAICPKHDVMITIVERGTGQQLVQVQVDSVMIPYPRFAAQRFAAQRYEEHKND